MNIIHIVQLILLTYMYPVVGYPYALLKVSFVTEVQNGEVCFQIMYVVGLRYSEFSYMNIW